MRRIVPAAVLLLASVVGLATSACGATLELRRDYRLFEGLWSVIVENDFVYDIDRDYTK